MIPISATDLARTTFAPPTAAELADMVDAGACTPMCLFGVDFGPCDCRCEERYHGIARTPTPEWFPPPRDCPLCLGTERPVRWIANGDEVTAWYVCEGCPTEVEHEIHRDDMVPADAYPYILRQYIKSAEGPYRHG